MNLPPIPKPGGGIRVRPPQLDPDRVREGRHAARVTAERKAAEAERQREEEERYPLVDPGDGRPPMRVRSSGGKPRTLGPNGSVLVGRMPRTPLDDLTDRVAAQEQEIAELREQLDQITTPTTPKRRFRK